MPEFRGTGQGGGTRWHCWLGVLAGLVSCLPIHVLWPYNHLGMQVWRTRRADVTEQAADTMRQLAQLTASQVC